MVGRQTARSRSLAAGSPVLVPRPLPYYVARRAPENDMTSVKHKPVVAVVDDDCGWLRSIARLLSSCGMEIHTFGSGSEFIGRLDSTPSFQPDCVILDMQMPGLNGLETQAQLALKRRGTPVVFATASEERQLRERALEAGAASFLQKPLDCEPLIEAVNSAVAQRSEGDA
jgi:FixJ family two-component response regulator